MCGLHIVVHADELEELINYYQVGIHLQIFSSTVFHMFGISTIRFKFYSGFSFAFELANLKHWFL